MGYCLCYCSLIQKVLTCAYILKCFPLLLSVFSALNGGHWLILNGFLCRIKAIDLIYSADEKHRRSLVSPVSLQGICFILFTDLLIYSTHYLGFFFKVILSLWNSIFIPYIDFISFISLFFFSWIMFMSYLTSLDIFLHIILNFFLWD